MLCESKKASIGMKLLIYHWTSYLQYDVYEICKEKSINFQIFEWQFESKNRDENFTKWFCDTIPSGEYDAVLSINYYPVLSDVCMKKQIKYIALCYDNPLNVELIEETLGNSVNYVFLFDKIQFWQYAKQGFQTVYHLPLGVNRTRLTNLKISEAERKKYAAEVSFVGNLYESLLYELMAPMDDYTKGYLNALMDIQRQIYGHYILDEAISEELIQNINSQYLKQNPKTKLRLSKQALTFAMASEITRKDRLILLNICGVRYDTKFYSRDESSLVKHVTKCGQVDYVEEMPKVFACSKVNLNPSLRIIQTGIPLRAFDVMGAGGFLLTNYQEELYEYYENEKDMVIYESMEDAVEKIRFYLEHEDIRCKIAESGRRKTLEEHSLQERIGKILKVAGLA